MEESEEPEQPISLGRQEYRRRRRPSQPMVDKSQQTEITEKKKAMAAVQPSAPKATHSIGNIPGSKDNYSGKEYESLRLSSQLQQTWMKRKHGQEMTDKSFQTDTSVEDKVLFIDKTLTLEENTAGVGETAPELPQSIPEVEIPTGRPTSHLIDRSQQTSCTGDWSLINICPKDKVDKEQQTYFSELEFTIRSMAGSSPTKSKEETMPIAQEGSLVEINGSLKIEVVSTENIPEAMMSFTEGEISGELQALPADDTTGKAERFTEQTPVQASSPAEETSAAEIATTTAKDIVDIQAPPADEFSSIEPPADISLPLVQGALSDKSSEQQYPQGTEVAPSELPVEDMVPPTEEVLEKVQSSAIDTMLEDSGRTESTTAEETTGEVQPLSEESSKDVPAEVHLPIVAGSAEIVIVIDKKFAIDEVFEDDQPPIIEEVSANEFTAEVQPPSAEDASEEVAPSEVLPPPTEQGTLEDMTAEVPPPPAEEGPIEVSPLPTEEGPAEVPPSATEEGPAEVSPSATEEGPAEVLPPPVEESPAEVPPPLTEEGPAEVPPAPAEEAPAEVLPPPAEEAPAEVLPPPAEETSAEVPPPPAEEGPAEVPPPVTEEAPADVPPPPAEEAPAEVPPPPAEEGPSEVPPPVTEEAPADVPPPPAEEAPAEVLPPPAEEGPAEVPPPVTEEAPADVPPPPAEEAPAEVLPPPAEEAAAEVPPPPAEEGPAEVPPPVTEESPAQEVPTEVQHPQAKKSPAEVIPLSGESPAEQASAEVQPPSFEKTPLESIPLEEVVIPQAEEVPLDDLSVEVQPLPAEEDIAVGVPAEVQTLPADEYPVGEDTVEVQPSSFEAAPREENHVEAQLPAAEADTAEASAVHPSLAPTDEAPTEIQVLQIEDTPTEVAPVEDQPLPAEEVFPKVVPEEEASAAEVRSPLSEGIPAEETIVEIQLTFVEESPKKASVDVQPQPPETPVEESPVVEQPLKTDVVTMQEFPVENMPAEDPLPPSQQTPADQVLLKEHRLSQVADTSEKELESTTLTGDKKPEGTDSVPEDVSGPKDDQISTFKIEGTIKIELKSSTS
ncbi:fibrous sheath CABYR-binding protein [Apodemus sylvaticus]|uniref:fibrous sheath CABYR-binding protein n=1 Tax=Apodemus sylvaticus TaxID=10129 RepID=UPI002244183D|nr:fibrous sheath CABYR-binding protein [Apodemus sylvaticus]